jgi:hypothetical protein
MFSTSGPFWDATAGELPAKTKIPRFARNDRVSNGAHEYAQQYGLPVG